LIFAATRAARFFLKLASRSDIIVQNFRPGTFAKWGVGYDHVRAVKPDTIYVSISGYGQFGPIHDRVAYDPLAQAMSGFISLNGTPDGPPMKAPTWLCDDLGGLHGAIGALAALRHRDRTGEGQHVDVAMLDAMLFQSNGNLTLGAMGVELKRWGNEIPFSVPTNTYKCRDGLVMAGVLLDTHWKVMARMGGAVIWPSTTNSRPSPAGWAIARNATRCLRSGARRAPSMKLSRVAPRKAFLRQSENLRGGCPMPHTLERDMLQQVPQEDGKLAPITGPAAKFSRTPTRIRSGAPALGAHTDAVLAELGIDADARKRLRESGVV